MMKNNLILLQGNFEEVASFLVESGADPNDVYTDEAGKEHNLLFDSVTLGNEVCIQLRMSISVSVYPYPFPFVHFHT